MYAGAKRPHTSHFGNISWRWALLAVSLLGMLALVRSTPYGPGLVNDSATYIEGAANLIAGRGFVRLSGGGEVKPITHFPPLFSILLAALGLLGVELVAAAHLLVILLFGVGIFLVGLCIYRISHSWPFALLGALLLAASDVHLGVYAMALSEPLFLALMLGAYLLLAQYADDGQARWLVGSGLLLSLATLTRYAGAALYLSAALGLWLMGRQGRRPTALLKEWGWLAMGGLPLPLLWLAYQQSASQGALGNRLVTWHPVPFSSLFEALKNLLTWAAPDALLATTPLWGRLLSGLALLVLPGLLAWLIWTAWRRKNAPIPALAWLLALHIPLYLAFIAASLSLFDASTPLDDRLLSVIYIPEMILFAAGLAWLWKVGVGRRAPLRAVVAAGALALALLSLWDGASAVQQLSTQGLGFTHEGYRESPAVPLIRSLPPITLYSNKPGAVYLLTGRNAYVTLTPLDPVTGLARPEYAADLDEMQAQVRGGAALLVLFGLRDSSDAEEAALFKALSAGLPLAADYGNVTVFGVLP